MQTKTIYRAAIVGCGAIAGGYDVDVNGEWSATHAGAYRLCSRTKLSAVCDINQELLPDFGKKWDVSHLYGDLQEMLEQARPDILSICSPFGHHFEACQLGCQWGVRAFYLEKPVSKSVQEALTMRTLIQGRPVAVNYFRRWNPTFSKLRDGLRGGQYGKPLRVTVHYVKGLISNGSHFIDLLLWFWGEPIMVRSLGKKQGSKEDPGIDFELRWSDGMIATFLHLPNPKYVCHDVDIFTDQARVTISQRGQTICWHEMAEEPYFKKFPVLRSGAGPQETEWRNCPLRAVEELIARLEEGGEPSCNLEDGINALKVCEQVLS